MSLVGIRRVGRCEKYWGRCRVTSFVIIAKTLWKQGTQVVQAGGNPCHSNHKQSAQFQKKRHVLPMPSIPKGTCLCACAMNWARSTRMKPLPTYFPIMDSPQKPRGA